MAVESMPDDVATPQIFAGEVAGVKLRWSALSDPGKVRTTNEDGAMTATGIYLLADGMGGHEGGEIASAAALANMNVLKVEDHRSLLATFSQAVIRAATDIEHIESKTGRQAGTTLTGAVLTKVRKAAHWLVVNIGDSRTYRYYDGTLQQLTVDHSHVQELIDSGHISVEQARTDARRNVITRALGAGMDPEFEYWLYPLNAGERLLICSDGLNGEVEDQHIKETLATAANPSEAVQELTKLALRAGARDNVTLIVVEVEDLAPDVVFVPPDPEDDAVFHGDLVFVRSKDGLVLADDYD